MAEAGSPPAQAGSSPRSDRSSVEAPAAVPALEAEEDDYDSAYDGDSTGGSSTTSIGSSILKFREENGRTYHAYKVRSYIPTIQVCFCCCCLHSQDGSYAFPNDEVEADRLDLQHHEFQLIFGGKLFTAPIPKEKVLHNVLDIGTGTGIWAIDFGDDHPESQVLGVDLSPIQPTFTPPNVSFQIDDVEAPWTYSHKFDFIYSRMMMCSLDSYPNFFDQAFANLNPGGYLEMVDPAWPIKLNDGEWPEDSALFKWYVLQMSGGLWLTDELGLRCGVRVCRRCVAMLNPHGITKIR